MTIKNKATVLTLDNYWEYAEIIFMLAEDEIPINETQRLTLRKLCEQGFTFVIYTCWLADDAENYYPYKSTPYAVNRLIAYAKDALARLSMAQLQATELPRRKINGYTYRRSDLKRDKKGDIAEAQAIQELRKYPQKTGSIVK